MPARSARIPSLDGLRAVSIFLVIAWHASERAKTPELHQLWRIDAGNLGVRVFFVISGFLITSLLLAEADSRGRIDLRHFYFRRTFRIMPAFFAFLAVMAVLAVTGAARGLGGPNATHELDWRDLVHAGTYTANYLSTSWLVGHTWSLSVEEQFYLLWPGLLVVAGLRRGFRWALLMLLVSPLLRAIAMHASSWPDNPRYAFECVADALATGCLLARYRGVVWSRSWYRRALESRAAAWWPCGTLAIAAASVRWPLFGALVGISALNVSIAAGLDWSMRHPESLFGRFLNLPAIAFIGTLSYSIYLWQQPFLSPGLDWPLVASLLGIILAALASYYLVERPGLRFRAMLEQRWRRRLNARRVAVTDPEQAG